MEQSGLIEFFKDIACAEKGICSLISEKAKPEVLARLVEIEEKPISKVQLNQLLMLSFEAGMTWAFFEYYWLQAPTEHTYDVTKVDYYDDTFVGGGEEILSAKHLKWGLLRIYIDSLLYFGNIELAYRTLKDKKGNELIDFFKSRRMPTEEIYKRGKPLEFKQIPRDDRYLISEMACKSYGDEGGIPSELGPFLKERYKSAVAKGLTSIKIKDLLSSDKLEKITPAQQGLFEFSADEILEDYVSSEEELEKKFGAIATKFFLTRKLALENTELYLSLVNDLDVYVATSMRTRNDFRTMADHCDQIFKGEKLQHLGLRYFDPTVSAADGHEDKGLIECLMVKCAKALVYMAGEKESYGKDAEAAMALSLGKPVIFFSEARGEFYKTVHPLSRLIDFNTGVAVGVLVTDKIDEVAELLLRIFENRMEYRIVQEKPGYYKLKDKLTESVVRLQTNNRLLTRSFWAYYHAQERQQSIRIKRSD